MKKLAVLAALAAGAFALPAVAQEFRFDRDDRAAEGKRASCEVYARIAVVQAEANRRFNCNYQGGRWGFDPRPHFQWCRFVRRSSIANELRERSVDLQRCFDRMGDFDDDRWDRR